MVQSAHSRRLLAATAVLAILFAGSCSKKDSVTAPPGGSGAKELDSANLASGAVYRDTFPMADGSFPYHCKIHGLAMSGTVTVAAGGSADRPRAEPYALTVRNAPMRRQASSSESKSFA